MAGVAGWGTRKTLEEMQARAREMYGPFRDETRVDPITGLSYQFSDIRPGQDRTDPVWLTPEQNEATRAYFADGGRIGDDGIIQKDVTKPAFTQNADGSYSSGSTTTTVTAPNVGTAWGYTGKPGVFTKAWGAVTGDDFPDQVRAKTPWSEAAFNSIDPFLPWSAQEGARIPPAVSSLVTEPARLAEKGIKGQEFSPADNAILGMTLFAAGGIGKGLTTGQTLLGRAGSKLGLEDPVLLDKPGAYPTRPDKGSRDSAFQRRMDLDAEADEASSTPGGFEEIQPDHFYHGGNWANAINRLEREGSIDPEGDIWQRTNEAGNISAEPGFSNDQSPMNPSSESTGIASLPGAERLAGPSSLDLDALAELQKVGPGKSTLHAAGDERSAFALGGLANDQRPFYGRDVGPKGRIGDVEAETARLGLRSGLPEDPTGAGFFNPATAALLQEGVQPKQTVAYYQKQMGARGGKLPPGQWEEITQGLRPDQTIERDWLVKEIDARVPAFETQRYLEDYDGSPGQAGTPEYQGYATKGPFQNYTETVLGYQTPGKVKPHPMVAEKYAQEWAALSSQLDAAQARMNEARRAMSPEFGDASAARTKVQNQMDVLHAKMVDETARLQLPGAFTDAHFDHPNMEGWYRTQDANQGSTRLIEEIQPQRYQKMRDAGEAVPQAKLDAWATERDQIRAKIQAMSSEILKDATDNERASVLAISPGNLYKSLSSYARRTGNDEAANKLLALNDRRNHLDGLIIAGKKGVQSSPYTHDINASTDLLLKHLTGKAARDDVSRIAWTPGETQAARYNQALQKVKGLRYEPSNGALYVKQDGQTHWTSIKSGVSKEELGDYVGADVAKKLLATEAKPHMPGANYSGHMLEFPQGMTLGGEGMKGFYGSGSRGDGGILTSRVKALWKRLTGQEPEVRPQTVQQSGLYYDEAKRRRTDRPPSLTYPAVDLTPEMRETIRRVGMSLYAAGDEKAALGLTAAASRHLEAPYVILDRQTGEIVGSAKTLKSARTSVNTRDKRYGASRYTHMKSDHYIQGKNEGLFSSGDEKAAAFLMQLDKDGQLGAFWGDEIGKRGADAPSKYEKRQLDANGLYSVLDESLPKINRKSANAQAWLNELKKLGVKDQEIYWRGLDDFLKSKGANGQFTKDEIATYLGNNKVKIWDELHDKDGTTAEDLREMKLESLNERFSYDFDPEDWGYKIEEYEPSADEITKLVAKRYKIEKTDQGDLFANDTQAPEGNYAVLDDDGTVREYADTKEDAELAAREFAKEDLILQAKEDGENWVLYDKDGDEYNRYGDPDIATDKARELAADVEADRIREMSDKEIWDEFGDGRSPGTMADGYMESDKPKGGSDYSEAVLGVNPDTLARKGSKGWTDGTGLSRDSAHPDSPYDHALGWRLQEEYRDLMNPKQSGLLAHELQSRWHARGTERGWRSGENNAARIAELEKAVQEAEAAHVVNDADYWVNWSAPTGTQIIKWDKDALASIRQSANYMEAKARPIMRDIADLTRNIRDLGRRLDEQRAMLTDPTSYSPGERESAPYYIKNYEDRLEQNQRGLKAAQSLWDEGVKPYIEREIVDETALPEGTPRTPEFEAYRNWAEQQDALAIAAQEARSRLTSASQGAHPGPFVSGEKSDIMGLLLKTGLYQAAKEGKDFFGVQGAKRMMERWGNSGPHEDYGRIDPKTGREAGVIPMTLQKLARMHRKDAKVEPLYPGKRKVSKGVFEEESSRFSAAGDRLDELPLGASQARTPRSFSTSSQIAEPVLTRTDAGEPVYVLKVKRPGYTEDAFLTQGGEAIPLKYRDYAARQGRFASHLLQFKTREAAEDAMRQINKSKAENYRKINDPENLKAAFAESDPVGEPFNVIRLDDDLRESILNRGFPMFAAGDERAALMAGAFAGQEGIPKPSAGSAFQQRMYRGDNKLKGAGPLRIMDENEGGSGGIFFTDNPDVANGYTSKSFVGDDEWSIIDHSTARHGGQIKPITKIPLSAQGKRKMGDAVLNYVNEDGDRPISQRTWDDYLGRSRGDALKAAEELMLNGGVLTRDEFADFIKSTGLYDGFFHDDPSTPSPGVTPVYLDFKKPFHPWGASAKELKAIEKIVGKDDLTLWELRERKKAGDPQTITTITPRFREALLQLGYDGIKDVGGKIVGDSEHNVGIAIKRGTVRSATSGETIFSSGSPEAAFVAGQGAEDEKPSNAEGLASRLMRLWDRK